MEVVVKVLRKADLGHIPRLGLASRQANAGLHSLHP